MIQPEPKRNRLAAVGVVGAVGLSVTLYSCLGFNPSRDPRLLKQQLSKRITMGRPPSEVGKELNRIGFKERPDIGMREFHDQSSGRELVVTNFVLFVRQGSKNLGFGREFWAVALALDSGGRVTNHYCQFTDVPFVAP